MSQQEVNDVVAFAYQHGAQVLAHCNGDAAIDMMLEAHRAAGCAAHAHDDRPFAVRSARSAAAIR